MRTLRKIVFINSANIRYGQVKLDGNVHFTGTQGVGKSTLLRAILFFYNADKSKLGIPREMRNFDKFYLPGNDSYIAYEVEHEAGPFTILVFLHRGNAGYYFIDGPFQRDWVVKENGQVISDHALIRGRVGVFISPIIDGYKEYRSILYGDPEMKRRDLKRFQLTQTNRYDNIYRSIQNVFLNSRLEANFIKDIIIRSMEEEESFIDLGSFYTHLATFERDMKDLSCWDKKDRKGTFYVRHQAEAVVNAYHELLRMRKQLVELCGFLKYAVRVTRERVPLIEQSMDVLGKECDKQKRLLSELQAKNEAEKNGILQDMGVMNEKLRQVKEKRTYYENQRINEVIARLDEEPALKVEKEGLQERLASLTSTYNDITMKFKALYQTVTSQLATVEQETKKRCLEAREERQQTEERLLKEKEEAGQSIEEAFAERIQTARSVIETIKQELSEIKTNIFKAGYLDPYKVEVDQLTTQERELLLKEKELEGQSRTLEAEIKRLTADMEKEEAKLITDFERRAKENRAAQSVLVSKIEEIDRILNETKGSLYEWLEENKKGWEENIGKVIHEEGILYRKGLHPEGVEGESLYGVKLDLTDLPMSVRRPTELKSEKAGYEEELRQLKEGYQEIEESRITSIETLRKDYTPKFKEKREKRSTAEAELSAIPQQLKKVRLDKEVFDEKRKEVIEQKKAELRIQQQEKSCELSKAEQARDKVTEEKQKQLKAIEKRYKADKEEAIQVENERVSTYKAEALVRRQKLEAERVELKKQEREELSGRGADVQLIDECKKDIKRIEDELSYIDQHRKIVILYNQDKLELLDKEEHFKRTKKTLQDKLDQLTEKYNLRKRNHEEKLSTMGKKLAELDRELHRHEDNLNRANRFISDQSCPPFYEDVKEKESLLSPSEAVDRLMSLNSQQGAKRGELQNLVNLFKGNFSPDNLFHFQTNLKTDKDYEDFASNLDEFLINAMLDEYRRRSSEHYNQSLARICKELGDLTRHESDVERVIKDINEDFKSKNFVGVIKLIALQAVKSMDKLTRLLRKMKEFYEENQLTMGELNLFSSTGRDSVNDQALQYLMDLVKLLKEDPSRKILTLSDLFELQFRIVENDNDTGWVYKVSHVGSEGTDTLVKAMINIMLINVFKKKVSRTDAEFRVHCMMDEIGKLHPENIKGILDFANQRNILLINSSPIPIAVSHYRYNYKLWKNTDSKTEIGLLLGIIGNENYGSVNQ